jgi:UDP-glucuronate 4-epimerase
MALQKFATTIVKGETLKVFNNGNHQRDFTYIDDIIEGITRVLDQPARSNPNWDSRKPDPATSAAPWRVYNIGNNRPINLLEFINLLERALGEKAKKEFLPIQPGDVPSTWANVDELVKEFKYEPTTNAEVGIIEFVKWFNNYYK